MKLPTIAMGTAEASKRFLNEKDEEIFISLGCSVFVTLTLMPVIKEPIATITLRINNIWDPHCWMANNPTNGPITIAIFVDITKYPIPSPLREAGMISATIVPTAVVAIPKPIPCSRRTIRKPVVVFGKRYKSEAPANRKRAVNNTFLWPLLSSHCPASGRETMAESKNTVVMRPATEELLCNLSIA